MYKYPFFFMIIILNISSILINNWMLMWILMELNLIIFIPLIIEKKNIKIMSKMAFKYFLIQSYASMIFMFSILMIFMFNNLLNINLIYMMMMISMFIKLGLTPFHMWFVKIMNTLSWNNCFILSTIQKIMPFMIMINMINKNLLMFMFLNIMNTLISTVGGLNQNFIKPLLAYSSLNHMSWMMIVNLTMEKLFYIYLLIYSLTNLMIMKSMEIMNINFINKIFSMKKSYLNKILIFITILSLGGIPPTIGFLIKWSTIYSIKNNLLMNFNIIVLLVTSTITMIYYLSLMIPSMMYFNMSKKFIFMKSMNKNLSLLIIMLLYLSMMTLMFNNIIN